MTQKIVALFGVAALAACVEEEPDTAVDTAALTQVRSGDLDLFESTLTVPDKVRVGGPFTVTATTRDVWRAHEKWWYEESSVLCITTREVVGPVYTLTGELDTDPIVSSRLPRGLTPDLVADVPPLSKVAVGSKHSADAMITCVRTGDHRLEYRAQVDYTIRSWIDCSDGRHADLGSHQRQGEVEVWLLVSCVK